MIDWKEVANADMPTERGNYMHPGRYKVQIGACIVKIVRKDKAPALIVEMTILESNNGEHQIGDKVSWFQKLNNDAAPSAVKGFLVAIAGIDAKDADGIEKFTRRIPTIMAAIEKDPQVLAKKNIAVDLECKAIKKKDGSPFTLHVFDAWARPDGWEPAPCPPRPAAATERLSQADARSVTRDLVGDATEAGDTEIPF